MQENGNIDAEARALAIDKRMEDNAYVRNLVARELEVRESLVEGGEPEVAFTVKLPVTDLALLEQIGAYLGHKKTPFASMLLQMAIQDAKYGLLVAAEEYPGKREEVEAYFRELHELEDGSGTVGPSRGAV